MADRSIKRAVGSGTSSCRRGIVAWLLLSAALPAAARAQTASPSASTPSANDGPEDIVVTGRNFLTDLSLSSKLPLTVAETPQSVTVFDSSLLRDLGLTTLTDAVRRIPGATVGGTFNASNNIFSRGYILGPNNSFKIDGTPFSGNRSINTVALDRLEFVRGGSGTTFGEGGPGGFLNYILKRPPSKFEASAHAEVGSFDHYLASGSVGGPLTGDGSMKAYVGVSLDRSGSSVRLQRNRSDAVYGALEFAPLERLTLNLSSYYSKDVTHPIHNGFPVVVNRDANGDILSVRFPTEVPVDAFVGSKNWGESNTGSTYLKSELQYRLSDAAVFTGVASYSDTKQPYNWLDLCCEVSPTTLTTNAYNFAERARFRSQYYEGRFSGKLPVLDGSVKYLLSAERRTREIDVQDAPYALSRANYSLLTPDLDVPDPFRGLSDRQLYTSSNSTSYSINSASATIIFEPWKFLTVTGGIRYDDFTVTTKTYNDGAFGSLKTKADFPSDNWSKRAAVTVRPLDSLRLYYSYGQTFEINARITCSGTPLPPVRGTTNEIGAKYEFSRRLLLTVAGYQARTVGDPVRLPISACPDVSVFAVRGGDGQKSRGVEAELTGNITTNWNIVAGYSYVHARAFEPYGVIVAPVPSNQFSLFTVYDIASGPLKGVGFGGGVLLTDRYPGTIGPRNEQLILTARKRFEVAAYYRPSDRVSFALNVENVTNAVDTESALQDNEFQNLYLPRREVKLSADVRF